MDEHLYYGAIPSFGMTTRRSDGKNVSMFSELNRLAAQLAAKTEEAERYKKALENVSGYSNKFVDDRYTIDVMKEIARAALEDLTNHPTAASAARSSE